LCLRGERKPRAAKWGGEGKDKPVARMAEPRATGESGASDHHCEYSVSRRIEILEKKNFDCKGYGHIDFLLNT
jgi:hypothetical protein